MAISYEDRGTIAAISTPPGSGGIGIIRISGSEALPILKSIFVPHNKNCQFNSHQMYYGQIVDSRGKCLDEVLSVYMQAPKSYTCEDVVEVHCHGSFIVLQNVLQLIVDSGAKFAEPGEFTKRAFLNGRIDLTRAEAVIDILSAKTRKGVNLAQEQLAGSLYNSLSPVRHSLAELKALLEVAIDFPDEDLDIVDYKTVKERLRSEIIEPVKQLLVNGDRGRIYREGVSLVIAGLPNVGKSSLLNALVQEERALVTAVEGTTRDFIEEYIDIMGLPVRIVDTAGIRDEAGEVEALGIERARERINSADLVLFMVDGSREVLAQEYRLYEDLAHKPILGLVNKADLVSMDEEALIKSHLSFVAKDVPCLTLSAKTEKGIDELRLAIFQAVTGGREQWEEDGCAPNLRHQESLNRVLDAAERIIVGIEQGYLSNDLLAVDIQECLDQLGNIVGETTTEDVLDIIFEQFCLGK